MYSMNADWYCFANKESPKKKSNKNTDLNACEKCSQFYIDVDSIKVFSS